MINKFTNINKVDKTLRIGLAPVGKTRENMEAADVFGKEARLNEAADEVKAMGDELFKCVINETLSDLTLDEDLLDEYYDLSAKKEKTDGDRARIEEIENDLKNETANFFDKKLGKAYFGKEFFDKLLPKFLEEKNNFDAINTVNSFKGALGRFSNYISAKKNMFIAEGKANSVPNRVIENLDIYIHNAIKWVETVKPALSADVLANLDADYSELIGLGTDECFDPRNYNLFLTQQRISLGYNLLICGYSNADGSKVKGLNEYINEYNIKVKDRKEKLPLLKQLYKQILMDRESISFKIDKIETDGQLIENIKTTYETSENNVLELALTFSNLLTSLNSFNAEGVYVTMNGVSALSHDAFHNYGFVRSAWEDIYDSEHAGATQNDKYYDARGKAWNKKRSFSLKYLAELIKSKGVDFDIADYYKKKFESCLMGVRSAYIGVSGLLSGKYNKKYPLPSNDLEISRIKNLFDETKDLEWLVRSFEGTGNEENRDPSFYNDFSPAVDNLRDFDRLYNKVRNYLTQKPNDASVMSLTFDRAKFGGGWHKNKESDNGCVLLRDKDNYYFAILNKPNDKNFGDENLAKEGEEYYERLEYRVISDPKKSLPHKIFSKKNIEFFAPSEDILRIRDTGSYKKGKSAAEFNLEDCHKFIDFYKNCLKIDPEWSEFFDFSNLKRTEEYKDTGEFFDDVENAAYSIEFEKISKAYVDELADNGGIYLFKVDAIDFRRKKKNVDPNNRYFLELFSPENIENPIYKMNGGVKLYYREPSIEKKEPTHRKNEPIKNKNPLNKKKTSTFAYDLYKDKRFTKEHFEILLPISANCKASKTDKVPVQNKIVRECLKNSTRQYVIGIARGPLNLIYYSVIDLNGKVAEQGSLNVIESYNGYEVDYKNNIMNRKNEKNQAQLSWKTIGSIKDIKNGYISQAVHKICDLVVKYDAIIAVEDTTLGGGSKEQLLEKDVYSSFVDALVKKLGFLVDRHTAPNSLGGLRCAYQLTSPAAMGSQNGIVFFVPAFYTRNADPTTGFVNLIRTKYTNLKAAKSFIEKFDDIRYNENEDLFEFDADYDLFMPKNKSSKRNWTVCSYGDRIKIFKNPEKENAWERKLVNMTDEFKDLFDEYGVEYSSNLKENILAISNVAFYKRLMDLISLMLRSINYTKDGYEFFISPVCNSNGEFFDSRKFSEKSDMPCGIDAVSAYNMARKAVWAVENIQKAEEGEKVKTSISNEEWLEFIQRD